VLYAQSHNSNPNLDSLAKVYNNSGVKHAIAGDFDNASQYFLKSLKLKESIPNFPKEKLANGYYNLGNLKLDLSQVDSALFYYQQAETLLAESGITSNSLLGLVYVQYGSAKKVQHDNENAIIYIKKGISLLEDNEQVNAEKLIAVYQKLSNAYFASRLFTDAIAAIESAVSYAQKYSSKQLPQCLNNQAIIYIEKREYAKAVEILSKSERLFEQMGWANIRERISLYNNLGLGYWKLGNTTEAREYFRKGEELIVLNPNYSHQSAMLLRNFGKLLLSQSNLEGAESKFKGSIAINQKVKEPKPITDYDIADFYSPSVAIQSVEGIADVYSQKYRASQIDDYAQKTFDYYAKAVELIDNFRLTVVDDSDMLSLNETYHFVFLKAIQWSFTVQNQVPNAIDYAFNISTKAKAFVLQQAIAKAQGIEFAGVPNEIVEKERRLTQEIGYTQEKVYEEKAKASVNSKYIRLLEDKLFSQKREQIELVRIIEKEYPDYFRLKYDSAPLKVADLQKKLTNNQVLVDYVLTDSTLISFAISETHFASHSQPIDSTFWLNLNTFFRELTPQSFESLTLDNLNQFSHSSYMLYTFLLKPFEHMVLGSDLIIVPHSQLASIPFSALLTSTAENPRGYFSLPYLLKQTSISYYPSARLYLNEGKSRRKFWPSIASFAPDYSQQLHSQSYSPLPYRQSLSDLPGAEKEAKAVVAELNGSLALAHEANEQNFRDAASSYDMLHLAMHTYIDEVNPLFSKLVFSHNPSGTDDGLLSMYELYGLDMSSRLTIISACRSGDGALAKGEGMLSLARGFLYAGCPSLIAAQWRVDDYSGAEVILSFVKQLKRGCSKSKALQSAQLSFIEKADPLRSHPYFWASYQVIGSNNALFYSTYVKVLLFFVAVVLAIAIVAVIRLKLIKKR